MFARHPHDLIGKRIGNYNITGYVASGTFGHVLRGAHHLLKKTYALKLLRPELYTDARLVTSFQDEARMIANLEHPNILSAFELDYYNRVPFFVTDFIAGGNLRAKHKRGEILPLELVVDYVTQIAAGLQYAHDKKIVHRDLKPENILVGNQLLLTDFGIAIAAHDKQSMSAQAAAGTPEYMAPEQFDGLAQTWADQYPLGIMCYEWLTGQRPFVPQDIEGNRYIAYNYMHHQIEVPSLQEGIVGVPDAVENVVRKALAKKPEDRFPQISDFAKALADATTPTQLMELEATEKQPPPAKRMMLTDTQINEQIGVIASSVTQILHELTMLRQELASRDLVIDNINAGFQLLQQQHANFVRRKDEETGQLREQLESLREEKDGEIKRLLAKKQHLEDKLTTAEEVTQAFHSEKTRELSAKADQYLAQADAFMRESMYGEALVLYNKILTLHPDNVDVLSQKSGALIQMTRYQDALETCSLALKINPEHKDALIHRADALVELGQGQEALDAVYEAIALDAKNVKTHLLKGKTLMQMRRYEEALIACDKAIGLDPENAEAHILKGDALVELDRYDEAIECLSKGTPEEADQVLRKVIQEFLKLVDTKGIASYDCASAIRAYIIQFERSSLEEILSGLEDIGRRYRKDNSRYWNQSFPGYFHSRVAEFRKSYNKIHPN